MIAIARDFFELGWAGWSGKWLTEVGLADDGGDFFRLFPEVICCVGLGNVKNFS